MTSQIRGDKSRIERHTVSHSLLSCRANAPKPAPVVVKPGPSSNTPRNTMAILVAPQSPILSFEKLRALAQIRAYIFSFQASTLYYDIPSDRIRVLEPFFGSLS